MGVSLTAGKQVMRLDSGALARTIGEHFVGMQARRRHAPRPPDAVVRLLELAFLPQVQHRQQHQSSRGHGQQRRLQTVEETCFHAGGTLAPLDN